MGGALAAGAAEAPRPAAEAPHLAAYRLAWADEFDGDAVDASQWNFRTGPAWWSTQQRQNVSVSGGVMRIALRKEAAQGKGYTAGGLISRREFRYGYYEARFRCPPGAGWHTSFWLMSTRGAQQEIDICENDSIDPRRYTVNTHRYQPVHTSVGFQAVDTPDLSADFHTWGCEFTPQKVTYYFEGKPVASFAVDQMAHNDHSIWLTSLAASLGGTKQVDDARLPAAAEYDYVRFFTPPEPYPSAAPRAPSAAAPRFVPDGRVRADRVTALMACDAERSADLVEFQGGGHGKYHVGSWRRPDQRARWAVQVDEAGDYEVRVLARRTAGGPLRMQVGAGTGTVAGVLSADRWQRLVLRDPVALPAGPAAITLQLEAAEPGGTFAADVLSVELVQPAVAATLEQQAAGQRASTAWMRRAGYGFMVHWTAQSQPRQGAAKPYADAVRDFDVERFADQMKAGGAGFVVFTTSHALQYFPAPLAALDAVLPGRTAPRDLVGDLARALGARGLKLVLYYHLGAGEDAPWLAASGFWKTDTRRFFDHWSRIVTEVGERYGPLLAGWWLDDGMTVYYHRSPDWRALTQAARAGYPQRVVAYNAWEYPAATGFQDYHCGEGNAWPPGDGTLKADGQGILGPGRYTGLQSCATLITEGQWGYFHAGRETAPPRWTPAQLRTLLADFARHGNVPIFNLEVSQEGRVSDRTIGVFQQAARETTP